MLEVREVEVISRSCTEVLSHRNAARDLDMYIYRREGDSG